MVTKSKILLTFLFSIDLLSEDLLSSTSDDAAHAELVSFSPSPTSSSTSSPSCPASQRHEHLKPGLGKKFFNINNPSLYDRMFGSDNGINVDSKTKEGKELYITQSINKC